MSLNIPDVSSQIVDRNGRPSGPLNAFFNLLRRALLLEGPFSQGDVIIFQGGNNGVAGGDVADFVKKTGTLTNHEVILGSGTNIVHALGSAGLLGQVLTSGGAGADPTWGGSISGLTVATVTITDAQIKALPTTSQNLVSAPGVGQNICPVLVNAHAHIVGGYANINADAAIYAGYSGGDGWSNLLANDSTLGYTRVTSLLGSAHERSFRMVPYTLAEPIFSWGNLIEIELSNHVNEAFQLNLANGGSGNLTGGDPANTLTVNTLYFVAAN